MDRIILHADCNKFYASVECLYRPEIRNKPVVVGGDAQQRHGIVLTRNEIAAKYNIKTGEVLWQAKNKCKDLVIVPPNFPLYMRFSKLVRDIYADYTDLIEPFGLDEAWLDVTKSTSLFGDGIKIANEIRSRIKKELGITVSVGVSFNKIFAKLGSDYKKPDAVTEISPDNFKQIVWPLPASDLLYVGPATTKKLKSKYKFTIGDIANTNPQLLYKWFGKWGHIIHSFANGYDNQPVSKLGNTAIIKSIGNSTTTPRDLVNNQDVKMILFVLTESVARRMREQGFKGKTLKISVRDNALFSFTRQCSLPEYTDITIELANKAFELFCKNYNWQKPVRSIGVSVTDFKESYDNFQINLFYDNKKAEKLQRIDKTVDSLKNRFGNYSVFRANLLKDKALTSFNPYNDHTIHPVGYFKAGVN